ncbi:hypothetical protein CGJ04_04610 [Vibrio parahaemolyticus]|uniref:hypothetical protein n=1 Tax=Vibrio parahaemolyticus TaxID=670 RepID=UPI001122340A|nr:hypothetical protein [Vibrio parahaemolyticus]TOG32585.1 hypothetical protein CGJ04_04610 [Vibrio parahaemolyticus]
MRTIQDFFALFQKEQNERVDVDTFQLNESTTLSQPEEFADYVFENSNNDDEIYNVLFQFKDSGDSNSETSGKTLTFNELPLFDEFVDKTSSHSDTSLVIADRTELPKLEISKRKLRSGRPITRLNKRFHTYNEHALHFLEGTIVRKALTISAGDMSQRGVRVALRPLDDESKLRVTRYIAKEIVHSVRQYYVLAEAPIKMQHDIEKTQSRIRNLHNAYTICIQENNSLKSKRYNAVDKYAKNVLSKVKA